MLLAELNVRHTRRHMPTRRVALDGAYLPTSGPAHGVGAARRGRRDEPPARSTRNSASCCRGCSTTRARGLAIPRIALRHRLQHDVHGLDRSRHRMLGEDGRIVIELDVHGAPTPQVLGAVHGRGRRCRRAAAAIALDAIRKVVDGRWRGLAPDVERARSSPTATWNGIRPPLAAADAWQPRRSARGERGAGVGARPALGDGGARAARRHGQSSATT